MRPFFFSRLGLKVAGVLGGIMALTATALIAVSTDFADSLGRKAADQGAEALREQSYQALQRVTAEQARRYGAELRRTRTLSQLLATRAEELLANGENAAPRGNTLDLRPAPDQPMLTNGPEAPASLVYFAGPRAGPQARQLMARTAPLDPLLVQAKQEAFSATAAWLTAKAGFVRYAPNRPLIDQLGEQFDGREGHFYRAAAPDQNPDKGPVWTRVYQDPAGQGLMVTASTPVYGPRGAFRGVTGIDVTLADLVDRILATQPLRMDDASDSSGGGGQFSFLTDSRGRIIAFPLNRLASFGIETLPEPDRGGILDISLLDSGPQEVRSALRQALNQKGRVVTRVDLDGDPHLLALHTLPGTNWLLGNVVAEGTVLAGVQETRSNIGGEVAALTRSLSAITLGFLVVALLAVIAYVVWSLVRPLHRLARAADQVRAGRYGTHVPAERRDELGQTGTAFNEMSDRLAGLVEDLEKRVSERTAEAEEARRHIQSILENSPVGITFLDGERRMQRVNSAFCNLFPYPEQALLGRTTAMLYASETEFTRVGKEAYPVLRDGGTYVTATQLQRADGTPFPASLQGRAVDPEELTEGFIWAVQDVTDQKRLEDELRLLATTFRTSQATFITDPEGIIERVNPAFTAITGYAPDEVIGRHPGMFQFAQPDAEPYEGMWRQALAEGHWDGEVWFLHGEGGTYPLYQSVSVVRDEGGEVEHFVGVFHDISEQKRLEAELDFQASHDRLTGIYNRKHFEDLLEAEINRASRYGTTFSLVMFDLDHFKQVNDDYGHHTGDDLLTRITHRVSEGLRECDNLARWGGEEFMLLLPHTTASGAAQVAERLRQQVAESDWPDLPRVTVSLGVVEYCRVEGADDLTRRVDDALYRAKAGGRDQLETA